VGLNPALQKTGGNRQKGDAVTDCVKLEAAEPGGEDVFTELCAQAAAGPFPGFGMGAVAIALCLRGFKARRGRSGVHHVRRLLFGEREAFLKKRMVANAKVRPNADGAAQGRAVCQVERQKAAGGPERVSWRKSLKSKMMST
jgi:hypothetical protein